MWVQAQYNTLFEVVTPVMWANHEFCFKPLCHEAMNMHSFSFLTSLLAVPQMSDNAVQVHELNARTNSQDLHATGMQSRHLPGFETTLSIGEWRN
jgi:hypothetical protein